MRQDKRAAPKAPINENITAREVRLIGADGQDVKVSGTDISVNITFQVGSLITVKDGQDVNVGDVLARIPQETSKTRDITGGLPRVAELFEARSPKDAGVLAEITGTVSFGKDTKGKQPYMMARSFRRVKPSWTAPPIPMTSCVCSVSRRWRVTSSTRCRMCTVFRV